MSRLLTCPMASVVLLTALLLMTVGSVVCGSPTDQWTDCSPPDSPVTLNKSSIMIQPVPLKVDHNWNISFSFENKEEITGGSINFTVCWSPNGKQPSIVLVQEQLNLCDFAKKVKIDCPVQIGRHNIMYTNSVSPILPPGYYSFSFKAKDKKVSFCAKGLLQIE